MNIKLIAVFLGIVAAIAIAAAVYMKIVQPSESQKAKAIINYNYEFQPHQTFGCARYIAPAATTETVEVRK